MRSSTILLALVTHVRSVVSFKCPPWLEGACDAGCVMTHCSPPLAKCIADDDCRKRLKSVGQCMGHVNTSDPYFPNDCLVPDNQLLDDLFHCAMEQHPCLNATVITPPSYPSCRDQLVPGDSRFQMSHLLEGYWYKVHSWKLGEPIECMSCQNASFELNGSGVRPSAIFKSNWHMPDAHGKIWPTAATATMRPRKPEDHDPGAESKLLNVGQMFGLTFWEPYTVVADGSADEEPYMFFYVCGGTLQGNYTTAFALAREPTASPALVKKLQSAAAVAGLEWEDFCTVDNSCFGAR